MTLLLGLDLGTSSAKASLFNADTQQVETSATQEYLVDKPAPDRAEQHPDAWWQAIVEATHQATYQAGRRDVLGISFSGQMHGTVLLDQDSRPVHPAIIWADQRSIVECQTLVNTVGGQEYANITGTLPAVGFMGPTLLWLAENAPELLERTRTVVLPKDYLRLKMTGHVATDISDAAGTGIFNIRQTDWAWDILSRVQMPLEMLPTVLSSTAVAGELGTEAAAELELSPGIPVIAGCADQPAQAIGNGLTAPGSASVTTGSGGQVFTPVKNNLQPDPRLHVFNHAVPAMWYILGAMLSAGLSLRWLRNLTGLATIPNAYDILSAEAAHIRPGADGLIFLPYLSGERTPHMDPLARGAFIGLTHYHQRGHLARAVMEGVAMALRQALSLSLAAGGQVNKIIAAGGGAESSVWRQIQADVLGLPLQQSLLKEQAGVGAALLAGVGTGIYSDLDDACKQAVSLGPTTDPTPAAQSFYNEFYQRFMSLYPRLSNDFHWLAQH